ncbi:amidohydrolase family protein [Streptomyces sp. CT34]|uniref:metal-dependent hydrolase family protein n=1 Tax=Streptomyces sp. CT34 TaxID=1553907 RepID=UPI0006904221|nr:amidohydrolase family protein [Streptomyces sp. CT34]
MTARLDTGSWLVTADRVLAGTGLQVLHHGAVHVADGVIRHIGREADLATLPHPATRLDLGDATLLPGLIDAHVHLGFDAGPDPVSVMRRQHDDEQLALMARNAASMLRAGVTTVRDLGARGDLDRVLADRIAAGMVPGPRLVTVTRPITTVRGHCWFMGGECANADAVAEAVRRHHDHGADLIKIMVTGGFMTNRTAPGAPQFTRAEVRTAVETAHGLGMRVAAHAHGTEGIAMAVEEGVDTLEHCTWVGRKGLEFAPHIADLMARRETYVCPTVNSNARNPAGRIDWRQRSRHLAAMRNAGVRLIGGTDAGIEHIAHHAYASGLEIMTDIGMTHQEVLAAATTHAATALGIADRTGNLAPGMAADLLGVAGNPLTDLPALHHPTFVMARGRLVHHGSVRHHTPPRTGTNREGALS